MTSPRRKRKTMDNLFEWIKKADSGDAEAQYKVAWHILYEMKIEDSDSEIINRALNYLTAAAINGYCHGLAALVLGDLFYQGRHVRQDFKQAIKWYRTATQKRMPIAYYDLGVCFLLGHGINKDLAKAFDCFFKGAMIGYINNYIMIGDMFKNGEFVELDRKFALKLYQYVYDSETDLFKKNNIWSDAYGIVCLRLGECYLHCIGVNRDIAKANYYFREAKEHSKDAHWKNSESPYLLQLMNDAPYFEDTTIINGNTLDVLESQPLSQKDFIQLVSDNLPDYKLNAFPEKELNELCEANPVITKFGDKHFCEIYQGVKNDDARSMYEMATICYKGDANCSRNTALFDYATYLYHQSLLKGCSDPLEILGLFYYHGGEVVQDYKVALFLYGLSEFPMALGEIGVCYANGKGVEKDYLKAYKFFVKCLLLEPEKGGVTYENMTIIYPHLPCFEYDQIFIEYCLESSKKYKTDDYDNF